MAENLTETEAEQIRRFAALQKVAIGILAKWMWLILLSFVMSYFSALAFLVWHSARSVHRFSAETKLLYNPRKIDNFESMDNRQLTHSLLTVQRPQTTHKKWRQPHGSQACA